MAIGEVIRCSTIEEVFRKAFDLNRIGIKTEFLSNCTLRVVSIANA